MEQKPKSERLFELAQELCHQIPDFFTVKGPGEGNLAINKFTAELKKRAFKEFGKDYSECAVCFDAALAYDYYFADEDTVVEVALNLFKPNTEYEKDIFKCLIGREAGKSIQKLMFIGKPGSEKKVSQPGRNEIRKFVKQKFGLEIDVKELFDSSRSG